MTLDTKLEWIHTIDNLKASASLGRIKELHVIRNIRDINSNAVYTYFLFKSTLIAVYNERKGICYLLKTTKIPRCNKIIEHIKKLPSITVKLESNLSNKGPLCII